MAQHPLASAGRPEPEYSIYVYHHPDDVEHGHTDWEMKSVTKSLRHALNEARSLYETDDYKKVEVKKRYFDARYERVMDATFKVLQEHKKIPRRLGILILSAVAFSAGLIVFSLPFIGAF